MHRGFSCGIEVRMVKVRWAAKPHMLKQDGRKMVMHPHFLLSPSAGFVGIYTFHLYL